MPTKHRHHSGDELKLGTRVVITSTKQSPSLHFWRWACSSRLTDFGQVSVLALPTEYRLQCRQYSSDSAAHEHSPAALYTFLTFCWPFLPVVAAAARTQHINVLQYHIEYSSMQFWVEKIQNKFKQSDEFIFAGFPQEIFKQGSRHETYCNALFHTGWFDIQNRENVTANGSPKTLLFFNEHGHTELDIDRQMYALISKSTRHRIFISVKMETPLSK
jgi:hypothetical protein